MQESEIAANRRDLRRFSDQPVAEIVQCGEPASKCRNINGLRRRQFDSRTSTSRGGSLAVMTLTVLIVVSRLARRSHAAQLDYARRRTRIWRASPNVPRYAKRMGGGRLTARTAAATILFVAAFEIFGCGLCSGDTCALQGAFSHQSHQTKSSGDECLCCCGHLLIASTIHVEPVSLVTPAPDPEPRQATIERQLSVYHPPRAVAV